jgi:hypothetical protein
MVRESGTRFAPSRPRYPNIDPRFVVAEFSRHWRGAGIAILLAGVLLLAGVAARAQSDFTRAGDPAVPLSERLSAAHDAATLEPFMSDYTARFALLTAEDLASRGDLAQAQRVLVSACRADGDNPLLLDQLQGVNLALGQQDAADAMRIHRIQRPNDIMPASVSVP